MRKQRDVVICRVCLKSDTRRKKCVSIFTKQNNMLIAENINLITNIEIKAGDGLPSNICPDCLLELESAIKFKTKCESSNNILKTTHRYNKNTIDSDIKQNVKLEEIKEETTVIEEYLEIDYFDNGGVFDDKGAVLNGETELNETSLIETYEGCEELTIKAEFEDEPVSENEDTQEISAVVKKSKAIDLKLVCNECGGFFKSKCKLRVHWKKVHLAESLICLQCKRTFKSYNAYNRHKKVKTLSCSAATNINIVGIGRSRVFNCKECSYSTRRIKDIISHLVIHTGEKPYVCDLCHKAFGQQSSLQGHKEGAHKMYIAETTCQHCGKYLKGRRLIYKHLKSHNGDRYQCDICKKFLKSKASLLGHIVRHTGIKSYTCEKCASTFYTLSELCNHRRMKHEKGLHIYKCDKCEYKTFRTETLKKHKARHTSTNVPCLVCGIFCENEEMLKIHQNRHFGERKFQCPHCEKRYMHRKALSQHVRDIHKCKFLQNKPLIPKAKTIKKEAIVSPASLTPIGNMIEIEVTPLTVT